MANKPIFVSEAPSFLGIGLDEEDPEFSKLSDTCAIMRGPVNVALRLDRLYAHGTLESRLVRLGGSDLVVLVAGDVVDTPEQLATVICPDYCDAKCGVIVYDAVLVIRKYAAQAFGLLVTPDEVEDADAYLMSAIRRTATRHGHHVIL